MNIELTLKEQWPDIVQENYPMRVQTIFGKVLKYEITVNKDIYTSQSALPC